MSEENTPNESEQDKSSQAKPKAPKVADLVAVIDELRAEVESLKAAKSDSKNTNPAYGPIPDPLAQEIESYRDVIARLREKLEGSGILPTTVGQLAKSTQDTRQMILQMARGNKKNKYIVTMPRLYKFTKGGQPKEVTRYPVASEMWGDTKEEVMARLMQDDNSPSHTRVSGGIRYRGSGGNPLMVLTEEEFEAKKKESFIAL